MWPGPPHSMVAQEDLAKAKDSYQHPPKSHHFHCSQRPVGSRSDQDPSWQAFKRYIWDGNTWALQALVSCPSWMKPPPHNTRDCSWESAVTDP